MLSAGYFWVDGKTVINTLPWSIAKALLTDKAKNISVGTGETQSQIQAKFGAIFTGFVNGETASVLDTQPAYSTNYGYNGQTGDYTITVSGCSSSKYEFAYQQGTLNVGTLNVTFNHMAYKGSAWTPVPASVYYNGQAYSRTQDSGDSTQYRYYIDLSSYANNVNAGTGTVILKLNHTSSSSTNYTVSFQIVKANIVKPSGASLVYATDNET